MYWDGETAPSVEAPVGDFFASPWQKYAQISSLAVCVNPGSAFNSYWTMPFRKGARITLENIGEKEMTLYYQVDYTETEVPADAAYFHAQFRRVNPLPYKQVYTLVDGIRGRATTSARHGLRASTTTAGGARARSSSTSTATASSRRSSARAPRTTSAGRTTSRTARRSSTRSSRRRTRACRS
jgi:hypothetical protein